MLPQLTTNTKTILFFSILIVSLVSLAFLTRPQPAPPPLPLKIASSKISQPTIQNYNINTPPPNLPDTLPIFQAAPTSTFNQLATSIASTLSLSKSPFSNNIWLNQTTNESLTFSPQEPTLTYTKEPTSPPPQNTPINLDLGLQSAQNFTHALNLNLTPDTGSIEFFTANNSQPTPANPSQANLITIPFHQTLEGYPMLFSDNQTAALVVWVGPNNTVIKVQINQPVASFQKLSLTKTLAFNNIVQSIKNNQGTVISINTQTPTTAKKNSLKNINLNSAQIQYRLEPTTNLAIPYLYFTGTTTLSDGQKATIQIIHPAVTTQ